MAHLPSVTPSRFCALPLPPSDIARAKGCASLGRNPGEETLATIVLCHGAWSSAWAWKKVRPMMAAAGHQFFTPSYTGLGERAHLAHPTNDLETHIQDVLG